MATYFCHKLACLVLLRKIPKLKPMIAAEIAAIWQVKAALPETFSRTTLIRMTLIRMTLIRMTLIRMTLSIMTLSRMTLSIMTLSKMTLAE